jgi:hypothetical protein
VKKGNRSRERRKYSSKRRKKSRYMAGEDQRDITSCRERRK